MASKIEIKLGAISAWRRGMRETGSPDDNQPANPSSLTQEGTFDDRGGCQPPYHPTLSISASLRRACEPI
ncbi:hypothetical protein A3J19_04435 [Candidatus Daviesbacteria bacterium RIFCSPLOWO2_02_FULL_41_8]|uniref:Uncharacterized protein n=2 Tax=Candidatus Daviesiibacteriota TaxID=1752718 RepID=A0A1F5NJC6_9BACT|nr:MAG: hypothetical protein A3D83_00910 [Candidatus Daviesbacteria bacterium RIFCSPHIGHO2_02_FULL_41_10]OGE77602.1 MAG: hypothetical protein A3J19_04435 [Candidatus Daviesbacteria bacterium RIFCSPLOWO2_02_FULL_41_8]